MAIHVSLYGWHQRPTTGSGRRSCPTPRQPREPREPPGTRRHRAAVNLDQGTDRGESVAHHQAAGDTVPQRPLDVLRQTAGGGGELDGKACATRTKNREHFTRRTIGNLRQISVGEGPGVSWTG